MPGNRLNHLPCGTSGSEFAQSANSSSCSIGISRCRTLSSRCNINAAGMRSRRILGIDLAAVKATENRVAPTKSFGRIGRLNHSSREFAQFFAAQHPIGVQTIGELNDLGLLRGWQLLDFLNDFGGAHAVELTLCGT